MAMTKNKKWLKWRVAAVIWVLICLATALTYAIPLVSLESRVKAAFIYNFAKFVEWPEQALPDKDDTILLCAIEDTDFGQAFDLIEEKIVKGRKVVYQCCPKSSRALDTCHIVYLNSQDPKIVQEVLRSLKGRHVLTVGELDGFVQLGGIINLYSSDNKIRFEINVDAANRAGLKLSSQLLKLAKIYREEPK
ncbi:MAG: YfiR family protein [Deltaproteobacteria bacterium]|nr:YfiR family protein [Deltaproteobacteria bacterium]